MNLYKVTCVSRGIVGCDESKDVFVVTNDPQQAEELALKEMRERKLKYRDYVSTIALIATEGQYPLPALLIVDWFEC